MTAETDHDILIRLEEKADKHERWSGRIDEAIFGGDNSDGIKDRIARIEASHAASKDKLAMITSAAAILIAAVALFVGS